MEAIDVARDLDRIKREALENGQQIQEQFAEMSTDIKLLTQNFNALLAGINRAMDVVGSDMEHVLRRLDALEKKEETTIIQ